MTLIIKKKYLIECLFFEKESGNGKTQEIFHFSYYFY